MAHGGAVIGYTASKDERFGPSFDGAKVNGAITPLSTGITNHISKGFVTMPRRLEGSAARRGENKIEVGQTAVKESS